MEELDKYLERAKDLAEDAGEIAKNIAGEVVSKAKELTEEGSKVRELTDKAKEQASSLTSGVREKIEGFLQDGKAGKEIEQGMAQLEALPEFDGSILYTMELQAATKYLNSLLLIINDNRLDNESVMEEIRKVMVKVEPCAEPQVDATEEDQAIDNVKVITYSACEKALEALVNKGKE